MTDLRDPRVLHVKADARSYVAILTCAEIDGFGHNTVFAEEISAALGACGLSAHFIDYRREPRRVQSALGDGSCAFFICFNGFGSELALSNAAPGQLHSVFGHYEKLLFDLMHDCPSHDSMAHQMNILDGSRQVLLTDYGYVQEAQELGFPKVHFVPSITFPNTLPNPPPRSKDRRTPVLLPIQLPPPSEVDKRFESRDKYRRRVFREIYEAVAESCAADLSADPRVETRRACREAGIAFDVRNPDHRFLLTAVLDRVKFKRRHELVHALTGLPVMLISAAHSEDDIPRGMSTKPARSFRELLRAMTDANCVICPLPHMTGYHERALGAFCAGAAVITAPNDILETQFREGGDMVVYRSAHDLADMIADLLRDHDQLQALADSGRERALARFSPARLTETMIAMAGAMTRKSEQ